MNKTQIQGTELFPSSLCMGTGDFGAGIDRQASYALLDTFIDHGGTFIDTAKIYSDWIPGETSRSEKVIGEWMRMRKNRQSIILATKGAHYNLVTPHIPRLSPEEIVSDVNASLRHLQTDIIDLYWLHRDDPSRPVADILTTLYSQVKAGKIRTYGCSNWRVDRLKAAQEFAIENNLPGFVAVQNMWSLARINAGGIGDPTIRIMDDDYYAYHRIHQLTAIPFSAQANGFFQKMASTGLDSISPTHKRIYLNADTERRFAQVLKMRESTGWTITQIVLGFLLAQPFPTIPVFSSRSQDQLLDTLSASEIQMTEEQAAFLLS